MAALPITHVRQGGDPQFTAPDWLIYRETATGPLLAQHLDLKTLRLGGQPRVVLDRVMGIRTLPSYAVSPNALVALQMNSGDRSLVWVNRQAAVVDSEAADVSARR